MSVEAMTWAFAQDDVTSPQKFVLVAIADNAKKNDSGEYTCYPGQNLIAAKTKLGVRTVRRVLAELEEAEFITRRHRQRPDGSRTSDEFILHVEIHIGIHVANLAGRKSNRPTTTIQPANHDNPTGHSGRGKEPLEEPVDEPEVVNTSLAAVAPSMFDEAYASWPKKADRKNGATAWPYAVKAFHGTERELFERVIEFADAYRAAKTPENFIPALVVWLHKERWDNSLPTGEPVKMTKTEAVIDTVERAARLQMLHDQGTMDALMHSSARELKGLGR